MVDSLQCALWCFINNSNVEDIICEAVNLYGDPDTIGAIAYGYNSIPKRWKEKIILKDKTIPKNKMVLKDRLMKLGKNMNS